MLKHNESDFCLEICLVIFAPPKVLAIVYKPRAYNRDFTVFEECLFTD